MPDLIYEAREIGAAQPTQAQAARRPGERFLRWTLVLSLVGYPIAAVAAVVLNTDSRLTSAPFRLFVDLLAVGALFSALTARLRFRPDVPILVLMALYLLRLMFDLQRPDLPHTGADLLFYLSVCVIPVLCATPAMGSWNQRLTGFTLVTVGALISAATLIVDFSGLAGDRSITLLTDRLGFDTVNPITLGHVGVSTLLAALAVWGGAGRLQRGLLLAACVPAAVVLVLANSRSPYLSLIVAVMVLLVARRRWLWLAGAALAAGAVFFADNIQDKLAGSRLLTVQDTASLERLIIQGNSLREFAEHPIFGSGYLDPITQLYPHNLFIESAMAMGIVGLGLYIWISLQAVVRSFTAIRRGELLAPLMFWQFFVFGQLSSAFFGAAALFLTMVLLSVLGRRDSATWEAAA